MEANFIPFLDNAQKSVSIAIKILNTPIQESRSATTLPKVKNIKPQNADIDKLKNSISDFKKQIAGIKQRLTDMETQSREQPPSSYSYFEQQRLNDDLKLFEQELKKAQQQLEIKQFDEKNKGLLSQFGALKTDTEKAAMAINELEKIALAKGYSKEEVITALRMLLDPSLTSGFSHFIEGANGVKIPSIWKDSEVLKQLSKYLEKNGQKLNLNGNEVDISNLLAGLDAKNHPQGTIKLGIPLPFISNQKAATYAGDLGSVVAKVVVEKADLKKTFDELASQPDLLGDIDAYLFNPSAKPTLGSALEDYYNHYDIAKNKQEFAIKIGLFNADGSVNDKGKYKMIAEVALFSKIYMANKYGIGEFSKEALSGNREPYRAASEDAVDQFIVWLMN